MRLVIKELGPGESFGERSLLQTQPVAANVSVGNDGCECFVLRSSDCPSLKISFPNLPDYVEKTASRKALGNVPCSPFVAEVPVLQKLQACRCGEKLERSSPIAPASVRRSSPTGRSGLMPHCFGCTVL